MSHALWGKAGGWRTCTDTELSVHSGLAQHGNAKLETSLLVPLTFGRLCVYNITIIITIIWLWLLLIIMIIIANHHHLYHLYTVYFITFSCFWRGLNTKQITRWKNGKLLHNCFLCVFYYVTQYFINKLGFRMVRSLEKKKKIYKWCNTSRGTYPILRLDLIAQGVLYLPKIIQCYSLSRWWSPANVCP